ncbi:DNA repair protein Rad7 [Nannizzia gypsea CBS 118893]|uniref:DNA repair protein Rad7 n=1 Tax=Arthroderma gypseum (strain ATCC MYA-4604 / CBS 118893) TaxID=535722 RepID=E4UX57_ARTGP|nr:DNA repair protein Rad7 [Nannizzia gypsea CBS 118893]EFR01857.1 DNA repair protein Rad7 [Nannizzia gypsea CBS 118893]
MNMQTAAFYMHKTDYRAFGRSNPRRRIQGPRSALTDFLAAHNISAADIRQTASQRASQAQRHNEAIQAEEARQAELEVAEAEAEAEVEAEVEAEIEAEAQLANARKRKRLTAAAAAKAKAKEKAKARRQGADVSDDDEDYEEAFSKARVPVAGQLANCELCNKRFTVTAYSKTGPDGGLLCTPCGKQMAADEKKAKPKPKRQGTRAKRQKYSNLLDGIAQQGAFSLMEMCIKQVANNINDVEEFGDLPGDLLLRLSQILSKRRAMNRRTLGLFLRSDINTIDIYDAAQLEEEDFQRVFAVMPFLERANLRCAGQLKDGVLEYVMGRESRLKHLTLDACNLVSEGCWRRFFQTCGSKLETVQLSNLDCAFDDETVAVMVASCPNLRRLKLTDCWKITYGCLGAIASLDKLEHLSLDMGHRHQDSGSGSGSGETAEQDLESVNALLRARCSGLRTLSLQHCKPLDNSSLAIVHDHARHLTKLRLSHNENCTDAALASLFTAWPNPPLTFIDLSSVRTFTPTAVDADDDDAVDHPGLGSEGFRALMAHSGERLERLDISSCRQVKYQAFEDVFGQETKDKQKKEKTYPCLREVDLSFHTRVDDVAMRRLFMACPALRKVTAFACFNVVDVQPPPDVALIGGLNAHTM